MPNRKTTRLRFSLLLLLMTLGPAAATELCPEPLVLGWEPWEPYQYVSDDGRLTGFDIELLRQVFSRVGCELRFQEIEWPRHLAELEAGRIHLAAGAAKTAERDRFARYSAPYRFDTVRLFVRRGEIDRWKVERLGDLAGTGFKLGVTRGYVYGSTWHELLQQKGFRDLLSPAEREDANVDRLVGGEIDGFLADPANVTRYLGQRGIEAEVVGHPVSVSSEDSYVLMSRASTSPALVEAFDAALAELRESGAYDELRGRFFGSDSSEEAAPGP